ncbi:MAG: lipase [Streptosporangiales bacterium]|nr:lipase [Streptosporangiales bacterium]
MLLLTAGLGLLAATVSPAVAASGDSPSEGHRDFASVDRPGPPLEVPADELARSLRCGSDLATGTRAPVLLVPGTTLTPEVNFSWNYARAFDAANRPHCTITLPNHAMSDIQVAGEHLVYAIRTMHRASGRKIEVVGFSQGGMVGRWALRFWPDTRAMVDDLVGLDPSNHGTLDSYAVCVTGCAPAFFQQGTGSRFLEALNSVQETFAGISYTQIYTITDEVVAPNLGPKASSALRTGDGQIANVAVQRICPVHVAEHLTMGTVDPVGYALVRDALTHVGPADPGRIDRGVCAKALMPGVDPVTFPTNFANVTVTAAEQVATYPHVPREPPLKPYVFAQSLGR